MAADDLIRDMSPSHPSALHAVIASLRAGSNEDSPLVLDLASSTSVVPGSTGAAMSTTSGVAPSNAESASCTRSTLLTNQQAAVAKSGRTAESISPTKSDSGGVNRLASHKNLGVSVVLRLYKPEKTGCRSKFVPSPCKIKVKIPVPSAVALTPGASTRASSTHDIPAVKVDDDGALTILSRSFSTTDGASGPWFFLHVKTRS